MINEEYRRMKEEKNLSYLWLYGRYLEQAKIHPFVIPPSHVAVESIMQFYFILYYIIYKHDGAIIRKRLPVNLSCLGDLEWPREISSRTL